MAGSRNRAPPDEPLAGRVAAALEAAAIAPGQTLCVALSGGVDSTVLLHLLARLHGRFAVDLVVAHVHHGLSPNADAWAAFCAAQCAALGLPLQVFRESVRRDDPAGLEAAARVVRHAALRRVACDWLAFGHHQDDQAETLLFRLLRGTGVRGAAAMAAIETGRPGRLRPLLGTRRSEIVAFARAAGLEWVEDESNAELRHARNLLRRRLIPAVEECFPAAVPALARAADNFREADGLLDDLAALDQAACGDDALSREALLALADARVRNLLRWRARAMGREAPARARLVEAVRQLRDAGDRPLRLALGEVVCCAYRDRIWLEATGKAIPPSPVRWRGEPELPWGAGTVRFEPVDGQGMDAAVLAGAGEVLLTSRWPGLAMRQGRGRPSRNFKNLCQEAGIPAWLRECLPVLRVDGRPAWIGEIGVAAEFRCEPGRAGVLPDWQR